MIQLHPPSQLGKLATYRQACKLASKTSRSSNPDWYRNPHELECQWHLVIAGARSQRIASAIYFKNTDTWINGPTVNIEQLLTTDECASIIKDIRKLPECRKIRSLGFILHLADEFATTEIQTDVHNPDELPALREEIIHSPVSILGDSSLSQESTAWRIIPYAGAASPPIATTISISRAHEPIIANLRKVSNNTNFAISTAAVSAPLTFLSVLPSFVEFDGTQPHIILLQYPRFSALAIFNQQGDLLQLRALQHRGRGYPSNLGDAINTAVAALDISSPAISLIPMADADPSPLITQLHATLADPESATIRVLKPSLEGVSNASQLRPEMLAATAAYNASEVSATFQQLSIFGENWGGQDFYTPSEEETSLYPNRQDMLLLRTAKILKPLLALLLVGAFIFVGFTSMEKMSKDYWNYSDSEKTIIDQEINFYNGKIDEYNHLSNILAPRSQAWTSMELLNHLIPDDGNLLVTKFENRVRTEPTRGATSPIIRTWTIDGFATAEGRDFLNGMVGHNSINKLFNDVAKRTQSPAFAINNTETRSLSTSFSPRNNSNFRPDGQRTSRTDASAFPVEFTFTITQRIEETDPLALTTSSQ